MLPTTTKLKRLTLKHPVPSRTDRPPKKAKADTDFITTNALKTIHAKPSRLSDEPPRYIDKPDFGRVPDYLIQTKKTLKEAAEHFSATQTMKAQQVGSIIVHSQSICCKCSCWIVWVSTTCLSSDFLASASCLSDMVKRADCCERRSRMQ